MGMTQPEYLQQLQALLPPGAAWPRRADATLTHVLEALADELARVDGRGDDLLEEVDPRTTFELLADWERVAGLPDECAGDIATTAGRRAALLARLTALGGQSPSYFVAVAAAAGYAIEIEEFRPFRAGQSAAGDPVTTGDGLFTAGRSTAGDPLNDGLGWEHVWAIHAPADTTTEFAAGAAAAGDPLRDWGNEPLECAVRRLSPAHTTVWFYYDL